MKHFLLKSLLSLGTAFALFSCGEDFNPDSQGITPGGDSDKICFVVSDNSASRGGSDGSRRVGGAFFYSHDMTDSIYVTVTAEHMLDLPVARASHTTTIGDTPIRITCVNRTTEDKRYYFSNIKFAKNASGTWVSDPPYWWLHEDTHFTFYGYAPADANGASYIKDEQTFVPKLDYNVPSDIKKQTDILYHTPALEYIATYNQVVQLTMAHALASIGFRTGSGMSAGTIDKITVKNVLAHGTLNLTDGSWALDPASVSDFSVTLGKPSSDNLPVSNDADATYFMLIPGCNSETSSVEIVFTKASGETKTYSGQLSYAWQAGNKYMYTVTIDPDFNISVDPEPQDAHYVICKAAVNVANLQQGQQWELTATASDDAKVTLLSELSNFHKRGYWTDEIYFQGSNDNAPSPTGKSARGKSALTGTASGDVYIFLPENVSGSDRTITLSMKVAGTDNVVAQQTITQVCPDWIDGSDLGWEQYENDPLSQWGFEWDRTVTYEKANIWLNNLVYGPMIEDLITQYNASAYATASNTGFGQKTKVVLNYNALNDLSSLNLDDIHGQQNTTALFNFAGGAASGDLEQAIIDLAPGLNFLWYTQCGKFNAKEHIGSNNTTSAALQYILKKNKYNLVQIEKQDEDNNVDMTEAAVINAADIVWFLPAEKQFQSPPQVNPLSGDYWSSTPVSGSSTFHVYTSSGSALRTDYKKVRACRTH